jgi:hypothetical protein
MSSLEDLARVRAKERGYMAPPVDEAERRRRLAAAEAARAATDRL